MKLIFYHPMDLMYIIVWNMVKNVGFIKFFWGNKYKKDNYKVKSR